MAQIKLGFSRLPIPNKVQEARSIISALTGNANFPNPDPALSVVTSAVNALETAYEAAKDGGKSKKSFMRLQEKALMGVMGQVAAYVQNASKGDATIIESAAMKVKAVRSSPQAVNAPQAVTAVPGKKEGEVAIKWKPVVSAKAYLVQQSTDGNTGWTDCGTATKGSITISGLTSGGKFWFRICAIGSKGEGPFSGPAKGMAA
jgi:hypothetical protein